jgi:hypothetical protein
MKLATAPVNWNSPDVPEYRAYTSYPQLLEEMAEAGYSATEWSSIMPKEPAVLAEDLWARGLQMLGGFVGLELRNPDSVGVAFLGLGRMGETHLRNLTAISGVEVVAVADQSLGRGRNLAA